MPVLVSVTAGVRCPVSVLHVPVVLVSVLRVACFLRAVLRAVVQYMMYVVLLACTGLCIDLPVPD